jgi:hypothetical protein
VGLGANSAMLFLLARRRASSSQISIDRCLRSSKLNSLSRCLIDFLNRDFSEKLDPKFAIFSRLPLPHASHPDPFEANGMPPAYGSMH